MIEIRHLADRATQSKSAQGPSAPGNRVDDGARQSRSGSAQRVLVHRQASEQAAAVVAEHDWLRSEVDRLNACLDDTETARAAAEARCRRSDRRGQKLEKELRAARACSAAGRLDADAFCDPEDQFRHEVYIAWTRRIPKGEKAVRPLPQYEIGPDFLASLETTEGVDRRKVVDVVVEVLTDCRSFGRRAHQLREDAGGSSRAVTREDGAVCWRVTLQQGTPAARRLHLWRSGQVIELSRVVLHDDMTP